MVGIQGVHRKGKFLRMPGHIMNSLESRTLNYTMLSQNGNKGGRVIVIGGGPAGMMAAGIAARRGLEVVLLEKNDKLGKKLYITGKGRCNLTNMASLEEYLNNIPTNPRFLYSALSAFDCNETVGFFSALGLQTKVERGNRVFPQSDKSSDVIKALSRMLQDANVDIQLKAEVRSIHCTQEQVTGVELDDGRILTCDSAVIATGGISYPSTGSTGDGYEMAQDLGHTVRAPGAALVPFDTVEQWPMSLQGLTLKNIELFIVSNGKELHRERGELLFTHFGISGPLVLTASSMVPEEVILRSNLYIDIKPGISEDTLDKRIIRDFQKFAKKNIKNALAELLPASMVPVVIRLWGVEEETAACQITREKRSELVKLLKGLVFHVKSFRPVAEAVITRGGVNVKEINPGTMESKVVKGLFFAGEVLDVDALTGGFNLQIAFSTGYVAGSNC